MEKRVIKRALISVYHKDGIEIIARRLHELGVEILSTGGTYDYLLNIGVPVVSVEEVTSYPSIFGGRVKTLHPKIFGGILSRRESFQDSAQLKEHSIPQIDLVVVDLYPFQEYAAIDAPHNEIIEKIDIGGVSLIRAAAKNYRDVVVIPSQALYGHLMELLNRDGASTLEQREFFAAHAFEISSHYDTSIFKYLNRGERVEAFKESSGSPIHLRYGENPHQKASLFGEAQLLPKQLNGKELSYNNLLDIEAALELIEEFSQPTVAILKHNNACGCASNPKLVEAWNSALKADPLSAFGGVIVANREIDLETAEAIDKLFFEVIIAPSYREEALDLLKLKAKRVILLTPEQKLSSSKFRSMLGGVLVQERDSSTETKADLTQVTKLSPTNKQITDLIFANKLVKHSKSNAIVIAKDSMLLASGVGQTSRVDALKQAITKAQNFNLELKGAVMASDAFFPFPDCVQIAHEVGIDTIIQPGGSIKDGETIEYCNQNNMAMVTTGIRHFKH